jgi:hypothetical protein
VHAQARRGARRGALDVVNSALPVEEEGGRNQQTWEAVPGQCGPARTKQGSHLAPASRVDWLAWLDSRKERVWSCLIKASLFKDKNTRFASCAPRCFFSQDPVAGMVWREGFDRAFSLRATAAPTGRQCSLQCVYTSSVDVFPGLAACDSTMLCDSRSAPPPTQQSRMQTCVGPLIFPA